MNTTTKPDDIRTVTIPAREMHEGLYSMEVRLHWVCPECGGPRGEPFKGLSYDGSRRMTVDCWRNPCGHIGKYSAVRHEARENGLNERQEVLTQ